MGKLKKMSEPKKRKVHTPEFKAKVPVTDQGRDGNDGTARRSGARADAQFDCRAKRDAAQGTRSAGRV